MNKRFTFFLLAFGLLFHACTKQTEVQPSEDAQANAPIAHFWQHTSDQSLVSTTISTLKTMDVSDSFENYVSKFGRPLWDSSLTSLSPGGEIPSSIIIPIVHRYKQFTNAAILGAYVGDKFQYQLVYRYYMPKELIKTADDKNRWEGLFQGFDKKLFNKGHSSGFQRKEEKSSGKSNPNARYIEVAITYCTSYYVTNSEGVPLGPTTTNCSTQYIYQWIDDAPTYTPPTPTNPGSGSVPVTYPPSGGGGGTTAPVKDITYQDVKSPCLVNAIKNLMKADFKNAINRAAKYFFVNAGQAQNINFKEVSSLIGSNGNPTHAETRPTTIVSGQSNTDIWLNTATLPGTSTLFQIVAIYHEATHAVFRYTRDYENLNPAKQHEVMASSEKVQMMLDAVRDIYGRVLTEAETRQVAALWLAGSSGDASNTNNFKDSMTKWKLTLNDVLNLSEKEEHAVINPATNKLIIGGSTCL